MTSEFNDFRVWNNEKMLRRIIQALRKRDFDAEYFADVTSASDTLLAMIPENSSVGIGGSVTVRELRIIEQLEERGNEVTHHWKPGVTKETNRAIRQKEGTADFYLTSANAITEQGDIINIDGIGNRVAHMIYGPDNVIIIVGYNKIVTDIESGIKRSREIAGVINAKRVGVKTPCAETGKCVDCKAPARICRVTTIMQYRPWQTNIKVMLINEFLGF
ncbi:MAG: lactate utilization protein [candidate division WOR-3 bacterium]|nr:MAG: lactate utilization protein [candidate division WOR-3 bacterium]